MHIFAYFRFTRVMSTEKILSTWQQMYFHFVNSMGKKLLQVLSGDLHIFYFDWWGLTSKQKYEKKNKPILLPF